MTCVTIAMRIVNSTSVTVNDSASSFIGLARR